MKKTPLIFLFFLFVLSLFAQKPELYILSVGVKNYKNPSLNLKYADADARDLAEAWKRQTNLYDVQETKVLLNEQATRENIRAAFDYFKNRVTANDLFIFIFSGHGMEENLVPYDFNINDAYATAFGKHDFKNKIGSLGCNYLVMLDACHSGSFAKSVYGKDLKTGAFQISVEEASKQLQEALVDADKNSIVIASSSSDQVSYECASCGHGYFAQTILDCFNGKEVNDPQNNRIYKPNRDGDANGFIYVAELENYVYEAVRINSALEGSTQKVRILKAVGRDFPLLQAANGRGVVPPPPPSSTDTDGDGFADNIDDCPKQKGTVRGCLDSDGDGVANKDDTCPYIAGTMPNGCPEKEKIDSDHDGLEDDIDECPDQTGLEKFGGCPDTDSDGIPDKDDPCPNEYGDKKNKGCPINSFADFETPDIGSGVKIKMVAVKGGSFQMGSNESNDEKPIHQVSVPDFYIGRYEITQKQWRTIMGTDPSYFKNCDDCPVEQVSWNDVQEFLTKLNSKTGKKYRLPTEAEWEYAARGGNKSNGYTYSGSDTVGDVAQYEGNNNKSTKSVGSKNANELGIYDMSGNVWEWCQDWYKGYPGSSGISDYTGSYRVDRGGSWGNASGFCRVASRDYSAPEYRGDSLGFRVAFSQ